MAARPEIRYEQERMLDMLARLRAAWPAVRRQQQAFNMRALWRLAIWGSAATLALVLAVVAGFSEAGSRRLMAATPAAPAAARASESETQARRLAEMVHILAADRERLVGRIDTLERNLEDMTGSIKRQVASAVEAVAASTPPAPTAPPAAAPLPSKEAALAPAAEASGAASPAAAIAPDAPDAQPAAAERGAGNPPDAPGAPLELVPIRTEFGVDVGGAVSFDGLRALWASTRDNHAVLFDALYPVVAVRENAKTKAPELRLVAGPLLNAEAAARICATLAAARRYCQPVAFEGQRLAQADVLPERKPGAAPSRPAAAPKPAPKPPARPSYSFR